MTEVIQLITAVGVLLSALASLLALWQSRNNGRKIEAVHLATNSMKDALVASTAKENYAAGVKHGEENRT